MENERDQQDVLMALQGMGRMSLMMDPVFQTYRNLEPSY